MGFMGTSLVPSYIRLNSLLLFRAHRSWAFHFAGSGSSTPSWYFPVSTAHAWGQSTLCSVQPFQTQQLLPGIKRPNKSTGKCFSCRSLHYNSADSTNRNSCFDGFPPALVNRKGRDTKQQSAFPESVSSSERAPLHELREDKSGSIVH